MWKWIKAKLRDQSGQTGLELAPILIPAISSLIGTGVSGVGAGMAGGRAAEAEEERIRREQEQFEKTFGLQQQETLRSLGMQGIGLLSQLRTGAQQRFRGQMFRDTVLGALGGQAGQQQGIMPAR